MPESLISNSLDQPSLSAALRYDWTRDSVREIYDRPLLDLIFAAQQAHRKFHDPARIQLCRLLSIKTGGCPEDCGYCPQSAHYETGVQNQPLMAVEEVFRAATIPLHGSQVGISGIHHGATQSKQLRQNPLHGIRIGGVDLQTKLRWLAVGASDVKLFDFETAAILHHRIENLLHDVRVNQMTLRFHPFLQWKRRALGVHDV